MCWFFSFLFRVLIQEKITFCQPNFIEPHVKLCFATFACCRKWRYDDELAKERVFMSVETYHRASKANKRIINSIRHWTTSANLKYLKLGMFFIFFSLIAVHLFHRLCLNINCNYFHQSNINSSISIQLWTTVYGPWL